MTRRLLARSGREVTEMIDAARAIRGWLPPNLGKPSKAGKAMLQCKEDIHLGLPSPNPKLKAMKPNTTPSSSSAAKLIVTDNAGHKIASAPAGAMAPLQFHIQRILVPVDFSEHSEKALRYALAFATQFGAEVALVHIVEQMVYPGDWMYPPLAVSDFATEKREQVLTRLRALDEGSGVKTQHIVRLGRAWQEVIEIANELKTDLIILATHGYTGLRHVLLGSVAEKILRHAPCPVLSVRADERDFL